jgi:tetratricopeptide (TPR) repeat protein
MSRRPDLRNISPYTSLGKDQQRFLDARLARYQFDPGEVIIRAGARGYYMAIVGKGELELIDSQGQVSHLRQGEAFGEGMLRYGVPSAYTVTASANTILWVLTRPDWIECLNLPSKASEARPGRRWSGRLGRLVITLTMLALIVVILGPALFNYATQALPPVLITSGKPELAGAYLQLAGRVAPNSAYVYEAFGGLYCSQGEAPMAIAAYQRAVELDPSSASALNNLGVLLLEGGDADQASLYLQAAVRLQPGNASVQHNRGNALLALGDLAEAAGAYRRAFELDPQDYTARALWAGLLLKQGKYELARQAWEEIALDYPGYPGAALGLGVTAVLDGRFEDALPYLEAARDASPNDPLVRFYLGVTYQSLGRSTEAAAEYELARTLSWNPELIGLAEAHLIRMQK